MRDVTAGMRLLLRGARLVLRSRRLLLVGAVPAVITTVLLAVGVITLLVYVDEIASAMTPFAEGWSTALRRATRAVVGIAVLVGAGLVGVVTFTALTLLIGGPFYEYLSETIENRLGAAPDAVELSWFVLFLRGLRDSVLLVTVSMLCTVPLLLAGLLPLIGQTVVPVAAACVGGWVLALEVVGVPFHRRGLRLGDRHRALRRRWGLALGVGVPAYLLCAIPFAAIVVMPAAVAAGTLLAREVLAPRPG